ncbi:MAG: hypothetical protein ACYCS4_06010 [Acidimicrobiales bacterium]
MARVKGPPGWLAGLLWAGLLWAGLLWAGLLWAGLLWAGPPVDAASGGIVTAPR